MGWFSWFNACYEGSRYWVQFPGSHIQMSVFSFLNRACQPYSMCISSFCYPLFVTFLDETVFFGWLPDASFCM